MAIDPTTQNLVSANFGNSTLTIYAPPYTGAPLATISTGVSAPLTVAVDTAGNIFVTNSGNGTLTEYSPPYSNASKPVGTVSGLNKPFSIALLP